MLLVLPSARCEQQVLWHMTLWTFLSQVAQAVRLIWYQLHIICQAHILLVTDCPADMSNFLEGLVCELHPFATTKIIRWLINWRGHLVGLCYVIIREGLDSWGNFLSKRILPVLLDRPSREVLRFSIFLPDFSDRSPPKVYQRLDSSRKLHSDISPTPPLIITLESNCDIWPPFATPVAFEALWYRNRATNWKSNICFGSA